jgi:hypothetical protein
LIDSPLEEGEIFFNFVFTAANVAQIDEAKLPSGSAGYCHFENRYRSTKNHQHMGQH